MPGQKWPAFSVPIQIGFPAAARQSTAGPPQIDVPELQMEKISGIVCGQGRERLLQFGAEQCLPILVVRPQRLKIRIPQMELHGGILRRDVDPGVTDGLLTRKGRKEAAVCPQSAAAS